MRALFFISDFILCALLVSGASLANTQYDEEDPAEVLITEERKIKNVQTKIRDAKNRYRYAERQHDRWQNANDLSDYVDIIENVKVFN